MEAALKVHICPGKGNTSIYALQKKVTFRGHHGIIPGANSRAGGDISSLQLLIVSFTTYPKLKAYCFSFARKLRGGEGREILPSSHSPTKVLSRHEKIANWTLKSLHCSSCFKNPSVDSVCWDISSWPNY